MHAGRWVGGSVPTSMDLAASACVLPCKLHRLRCSAVAVGAPRQHAVRNWVTVRNDLDSAMTASDSLGGCMALVYLEVLTVLARHVCYRAIAVT